MRQADRNARSSTHRAPAKRATAAKARTQTKIAPRSRVAAPPAPRPVLALTAPGTRIKKDGVLPVQVAFSGCDEVRLELEPLKMFRLDVASLSSSGEVRLLGRRDGKATLIATGMRMGVPVIQRMLHLDCDGPVVRILGFGYTAPAA
jgi:hypothetical protein